MNYLTSLLYKLEMNKGSQSQSPQLVSYAFVLPDRIENNAQANRHKHIIDTLDTMLPDPASWPRNRVYHFI